MITVGTHRVRPFGARFVLESQQVARTGSGLPGWLPVKFPGNLEHALASLGEAEIGRRAQDAQTLESLLAAVRSVRDEIVGLGGM
jgi:hypothetical protein